MKILTTLCLIIALSSCAGGWTEDDKKKFRDDCAVQAKSQLPDEMADKYCKCFVDQMVQTYPVFNDAMEHVVSDTVEQLKARCRQEIGLP